jgi:hypothetical protein
VQSDRSHSERRGWYRGYWCDSTYELVFVARALDHELPLERNLECFPYEYEAAVLHWTPDFLLADGTYIEIKGYLSGQAEAKFDYFYRPLRVLARSDLQQMFDHVYNTYGRNVVALYE